MSIGVRKNQDANGQISRIVVERENGKKQEIDADEQQSPVARLFGRLGGAGKIKVYRLVEGEERYSCTMDVSEDLADNLEQKLGEKCGCGTFSICGFDSGKNLGRATIHIDERLFPPRRTTRERERDGELPEPAPAPAGDMAVIMQTLLAQAKRDAEVQQQQQASAFALALQLMENASARQLELIKAMHAKPSEGAPPSIEAGLSGVTNVIRLLESLGFQRPGVAQPGEQSHLSLGERVLEAPLTAIGKRVGDFLVDSMKPAPAPPVSKPTSPPAGPAPAAQALPAQPVAPKLPTGAKLYTREELQQRLAQRNAGTPAAPTVREVAPPQPKAKEG